ncbi:MAG: DUF4157 domain-containing protein [Sphingomicrobium sp.]
MGDTQVTSFDEAAECGSAIAAAAVANGGRPLTLQERRFFEQSFKADLSAVRIHCDSAAQEGAKAIGADAYALGNAIAMPSRVVSPVLLAHELAHVVQQRSISAEQPIIQRHIAAADLPKTPVEAIMSDPDYFENGIERIEFFSAELARLHYPGGKQLDVGLVPEWIESPIEAVDYHTLKSEHASVVDRPGSLGTGSMKFVPRATSLKTGPGVTFADVIRETARTIRFAIHAGSGRIVPTEVNSLSAPRLCEALRRAEAEYVARTDALAANAVQTFKAFEWIIMLASMRPAAPLASGAAAEISSGAAAIAANAAERRAIAEFTPVLSKIAAGAARGGAELVVEGVELSGIRATVQGTEMISSYSIIVNAGKVAGRGRLVHGAFETACIQAARSAGMRSARVAVELVQNPKWAAHLESLGYSWDVVTIPPSLFTRVLTKVFAL